jgi:hypothetical protein
VLSALGLIAAVGALAGCATAARSPAGARPTVAKVCHAPDDGVVVARPLAGDALVAGPVLVGHHAVWAESGSRVRMRSVDLHGCARNIYVAPSEPRPPKSQGKSWLYSVDSLVGSDGRVAMVESVLPCWAPRASVARCELGPDGVPPARIALLSGRPGHIRAVESLSHPDQRPCVWTPDAAAIADQGLVVQETQEGRGRGSCPQFARRVVLRSFAGRLVRVLARGPNIQYLVAAGRWAMYSTYSNSDSTDVTLHAVNVTTGRTVLRLHRGGRHGIVAYAIDRSGRFALITEAGQTTVCGTSHETSPLSLGRIGQTGLRVIDTHPLGNIPDIAVAISGDRVAFGQQTGPCLDHRRLVVQAPGSSATVIAHMSYSFAAPLRFDGRVIATARGRASGPDIGAAIVLRSVSAGA